MFCSDLFFSFSVQLATLPSQHHFRKMNEKQKKNTALLGRFESLRSPTLRTTQILTHDSPRRRPWNPRFRTGPHQSGIYLPFNYLQSGWAAAAVSGTIHTDDTITEETPKEKQWPPLCFTLQHSLPQECTPGKAPPMSERFPETPSHTFAQSFSTNLARERPKIPKFRPHARHDKTGATAAGSILTWLALSLSFIFLSSLGTDTHVYIRGCECVRERGTKTSESCQNKKWRFGQEQTRGFWSNEK